MMLMLYIFLYLIDLLLFSSVVYLYIPDYNLFLLFLLSLLLLVYFQVLFLLHFSYLPNFYLSYTSFPSLITYYILYLFSYTLFSFSPHFLWLLLLILLFFFSVFFRF